MIKMIYGDWKLIRKGFKIGAIKRNAINILFGIKKYNPLYKVLFPND